MQKLVSALVTGEQKLVEDYDILLERWLEFRMSPINEGLFVFVMDITEKKNQRHALEKFTKKLNRPSRARRWVSER